MRAIEILKAKCENDILRAFLGLIAIMTSIEVKESPFKESKVDKIILNLILIIYN